MNTATIDYMATQRGVGFRMRQAICQAYDAGFSEGVASVLEAAGDKRNGERMVALELEEEVIEFVNNLIGDRNMNFQISVPKLMEKARRGFYFAHLMDWPAVGDDLEPQHGKLFAHLITQAVEGQNFQVARRRWHARTLRGAACKNLWFEIVH